MVGKMAHQHPIDYSDPFSAGQMVGMLVMLTYIEQNEGITSDVIDQLKKVAAENVQEYLDKPTEDIHLMIENIVKEIKI